jgi:hypothetical protein
MNRTTHTPEGIAREKLPLGVHENLDAERYHAAWGVSNSDLKKFAESPEIYYNARILGVKEDDSDLDDNERKSRVMGSLLHLAILEPHRFGEGISHHQKPETYPAPKTSKAVKSGAVKEGDPIPWSGNATFCQDWKDAHDDKPVISLKELNRIYGARDAVLKHAVSGPLFAGPGKNEVSIVAEHPETGLTLRMRADRIAQDAIGNSWIIDVKSVPDVDAFVRSARQFRYNVQSVAYEKTASLAGVKDVIFCFVCVELKPRYGVHTVRVVCLSEGSKSEALEIWERDLRRFAECQEKNEWPASGKEIELIQIRAWGQ